MSRRLAGAASQAAHRLKGVPESSKVIRRRWRGTPTQLVEQNFGLYKSTNVSATWPTNWHPRYTKMRKDNELSYGDKMVVEDRVEEIVREYFALRGYVENRLLFNKHGDTLHVYFEGMRMMGQDSQLEKSLFLYPRYISRNPGKDGREARRKIPHDASLPNVEDIMKGMEEKAVRKKRGEISGKYDDVSKVRMLTIPTYIEMENLERALESVIFGNEFPVNWTTKKVSVMLRGATPSEIAQEGETMRLKLHFGVLDEMYRDQVSRGINSALGWRKEMALTGQMALRINLGRVAQLMFEHPCAPLVTRFLAREVAKTRNHRVLLRMVETELQKIWERREELEIRQGRLSDKQSLRGVMVQFKGRLNGSERKDKQRVFFGKMPRQTVHSNVDYFFVPATTPQGQIGVKVWMHWGE